MPIYNRQVSGPMVPTFSCGTPGDLSVAYGSQTGGYTLASPNLVYFSFGLTCTPTFSTASGNILLGGLPFPVSSLGGGWMISNISAGFTWPASTLTITGFLTVSGSTFGIRALRTGAAVVNFAMTNIVSAAAITIAGNGVYQRV